MELSWLSTGCSRGHSLIPSASHAQKKKLDSPLSAKTNLWEGEGPKVKTESEALLLHREMDLLGALG